MEVDPQLAALALDGCLSDAQAWLYAIQSAQPLAESPHFFQGMIAPASMFAVESFACLSQLAGDTAPKASDLGVDFLQSSRHRAKLLDYASVGCVADELLSIARQQRLEFNKDHGGVLGPLKRAIQPDMGLSVCDGHIFSNSHATVFGFGSNAVSSENAFRFGEAIGAYTSSILEPFGRARFSPANLESTFGGVEMRDIKYDSLYRRGELGSGGLRIGASMALLLTATNLTRLILSQLLPPDGHSRFRQKMITAYHVVAGAKSVQDGLVVPSGAPSEVRAVLATLIGETDAKWVRRQNRVRNLLVHYLPDPRSPDSAFIPSSRTEQIEHAMGVSIDEAESILDRYLTLVSRTLEDGFNLRPTTFAMGRVT